jgi:hypothetical protein
MPVIRISDSTWERLKVYARPLEDTPEDVVRLALDALDASRGHKPPAVKAQKRPAAPQQGKKTPQREFRAPLLKAMLGPADLAPVSTGEARWWNAVCWERNDLVKEGLFRKDSDRGIWELSDTGRKAAKALA